MNDLRGSVRQRAFIPLFATLLLVGSCGGGDGRQDGSVDRPVMESGRAPDDGAEDPGAGEGPLGPDGSVMTDGSSAGVPTLTARFVSAVRSACEFSGPLAVQSRGENEILMVTADGTLTAIDPVSGADRWQMSLPAPAGLTAHLVAPPATVPTHRLVLAWQDVSPDWTRMNHHVGVVDLEQRTLDPQFPVLTVTGSKPAYGGSGTISFVPAHAYARSAVAYAELAGRELGLAYVSYGNVRDLPPWHGWIFEVDLEAWRAEGASGAITASMVTTDEDNCGPENSDGSRGMLCGGGIWSHFGPEIVYDPQVPDGFSLFVATGNGALDPTRGDFANSVLRLGRGLRFDAGCDPLLCDGFDSIDPSPACLASCENLFMPRLAAGQSVPDGANRACVGRTLLGCYAALDWDLGASAPAITPVPGGPTVIVQPGKDGSVYLVDATHLGTLYDRAPIMDGCGEQSGHCKADWAGTIVTRPKVVTVDGRVLALVPTFVEDDAHPAGLQALEISVEGGTPHLVPRWQAPAFDTPEAIAAFRNPAGGVTVADVGGDAFAAVVATGPRGQAGTLYWVRVRDGAILQRVQLAGPGQRYAAPLVFGDGLYLPSCQHTGSPDFNEGTAQIEAFTISAP